ncbi:MAG: hypothetical protein H0W44_05675 [Gammaproteobacteria bacterium]|nr:hypothetical protein [Gammaproteobacteria bacterium]
MSRAGLPESNLRKLAIAYASGKVDRENYRKLRTRQLSALDFDKALPDLPDEIAAIGVPSVKVDAPKNAGGNLLKGRSLKTIVMAIAAIVLVGIVGIYFTGDNKKSNEQTQNTQKIDLAVEAQKLIQKPEWTNSDMGYFKRLWDSQEAQELTTARESRWFADLERDIVRRINENKQLMQTAEDSEAVQKQLTDLRLFYAQLATE